MTLQEFAVRQRLSALSSEFNRNINYLVTELTNAFAETNVPENMFRLFGALQGLKLATQLANTVITTLMLQEPTELPDEWREIVDGVSEDNQLAVHNFIKSVAQLALQSVVNENHEGVTDFDLYVLQGSIRCLKALAELSDDVVMEVCR